MPRKTYDEVRFPSPQRGRGVGGEGASIPLAVLASVLRSSSRAEFRELILQRGIPPHPQPLSRVGARGADPCKLAYRCAMRLSNSFSILERLVTMRSVGWLVGSCVGSPFVFARLLWGRIDRPARWRFSKAIRSSWHVAAAAMAPMRAAATAALRLPRFVG